MPDSALPRSSDDARPGDRLIRLGALLFVVGGVGVLGVVLPFFLGRDDAPLGWTLVASVMPVGLGLAMLGLLRGARRGRKN